MGTCKCPLDVNVTNQTCSSVLPDVKRALCVWMPKPQRQFLWLWQSWVWQVKDQHLEIDFLVSLFYNSNSNFNSISFLLEWQAAIWFEKKASKRLCLHIWPFSAKIVVPAYRCSHTVISFPALPAWKQKAHKCGERPGSHPGAVKQPM